MAVNAMGSWFLVFVFRQQASICCLIVFLANEGCFQPIFIDDLRLGAK